MGIYPVPPAARNRFIPVDFVYTAMLRISLSKETLGHSFNIVRPEQEHTVTLDAHLRALGPVLPLPIPI